MTHVPIYRAGVLAYCDSFRGLLPCKVLKVTTDDGPIPYVTVKLTRKHDRELYTPQMPYWHVTRVIPRDRVIGLRSISGPRILSYHWEAS